MKDVMKSEIRNLMVDLNLMAVPLGFTERRAVVSKQLKLNNIVIQLLNIEDNDLVFNTVLYCITSVIKSDFDNIDSTISMLELLLEASNVDRDVLWDVESYQRYIASKFDKLYTTIKNIINENISTALKHTYVDFWESLKSLESQIESMFEKYSNNRKICRSLAGIVECINPYEHETSTHAWRKLNELIMEEVSC